MKFLACSQCISADPSHHRGSQPVQEITNPLVITKRPTPKAQPSTSQQHPHHHHHHHQPKKKSSSQAKRVSPPASPTPAAPSTSAAAAAPSPVKRKKRRLPSIFRSITLWSTSRRRYYAQQPQPQPQPNRPSSVTMTKSKKSARKTVRVVESPASCGTACRRRLRNRAASTTNRTQRLIRLYEERAHSPEGRYRQCNEEFLLDPPASFGGCADDSIESHQNFRNKLNTLDFKRMNTVALEAPSTSAGAGCSSSSDSAIYRKNSYNEKEAEEAMPVHKYPRKTMLEDFLKERLKIEQTMIDLLNGQDPGTSILKRSRNEDKKVRFKVEQDADKRCYAEDEDERQISLDVVSDGDKRVDLKEPSGKFDQKTEIKLSLDPMTKVEDFYVEKRTTYLKGKTVEDKSLVLKIAPKTEQELEIDDAIGIGRGKEMVFYNFGKMSL